MIETFVYEIDKQITSSRKLFEETKFEIFKSRIQKLEAQKSKILKSFNDATSKIVNLS